MKNLLLTYFVVLFFASLHSQTYFDLRKQYPSTTNNTYITSLGNLKKYNESEIKAAFDSIKFSPIQFNYTQGGCQNRAQTMSLILTQKLQLSHSKVWIFCRRNLDITEKGALVVPDKNHLTSNDKIFWNYHVAPCVLMFNGKTIDTMIIDPSLNPNGPMKIREWFGAMEYSNVANYTFLNPEWYFFELDSNSILTGTFLKFDIDTKWCSDNFRNLTLEKSLAINDMAIYILNKHLIPMSKSTEENVKSQYNSLRLLFGNVDALTAFFSNLNGYCGIYAKDNLSFRKYYQDFPELMSDAMKYYIDRLNFWVSEIKILE